MIVALHPPTWCAELCGWPFELGASGPDAFDCWGLVRAALRRGWNVEPPEHPEVRTMRAGGQLEHVFVRPTAWSEVDRLEARPGDVLVMGGSRGGLHVGVVVAPGWMLHAREGVISCLERTSRAPWSNAITAVYRHEELVP